MPNKECAYCEDGDGSETDDHVPPKTIFPKPRPNDLITVPSCAECNTGDSKDDEYFRLTMASRGEANDNESAKKVIASAIRGLNRKQAAGFAKTVANSMSWEDVTTSGGIYLGPQVVVTADLARLLNVVDRIAHGIYFNEHGKKIPSTHELTVFPLDSKTIHDNQPLRMLIAGVSKTTFTKIGDGVFSFARTYADGDDSMSFWMFEFYETSCFGALINPASA